MNHKEFPSDATLEPEELVRQNMSSKKLDIQSHWTVYRADVKMTYGGLHEEEAGAEEARQALILKAKSGYPPGKEEQAERAANIWEANTKLKFLYPGEVFEPNGATQRKHTHGATDGTHGSKVRPLIDRVFF